MLSAICVRIFFISVLACFVVLFGQWQNPIFFPIFFHVWLELTLIMSQELLGGG